MKKNILIILLFVLLVFVFIYNLKDNSEVDHVPFNSEKWKVGHVGGTFGSDIDPFREKMIYALIRNYKIHNLNKEQILNLLGPPDSEIISESIVVYWLDWQPKAMSVDTLWQKELRIKFHKKNKTVSDFDVLQWWDTIY